MKRFGLFALLALALALPATSMTPEARRRYLDRMLQTLPDVPSFRQWVQKTGELPPDFDMLPRMNDLPDPLRFLDGRQVRNAKDWEARRGEIKALFERYVLGAFPPRPKIDRAVQVDETRGLNCRIRHVRVEFGRANKGTLRVELLIPDGKGPFPVFLGPGIRPWAQLAVRRGYLCVLYAGSDFQDDAAGWADLFPGFDFALLPRRAWAGSLALDYAATLPEADMKHVALTGHSRDGKQALIEAAFDERITAIVASSTGVGGELPYRLKGERGQGEGIEAVTRAFPAWFHPRLRFFAGREDRLPVDGNLLVALVAPRACLMSYAVNDAVSDPWADEQSYHSALAAYRFLGHPERLGVRTRPGGHAIPLADIEEYLDWFDMQFGRTSRQWVSNTIYDYDFESWRGRGGEPADIARMPRHDLTRLLSDASGAAINTAAQWETKAAAVRQAVEAMLGQRPAWAPSDLPRTALPAPPPPPDDLTSQVLRAGASFGWRKPESEQVTVERNIKFGQGVTGDLFYPASAAANAKLPAVIWLHGYSYATGYWYAYRTDLNPILALVKAGYAVLAFDQVGFGRRIFEAKRWADRFPRWSQMGQMIVDTRAGIDALTANPRIDARRIYLFGYSLGGTLAIYTAALDPRVKGVVSICGFTPMRLDTAERGAGGVARYSRQRALIPRLGFFAGHEAQIPYDFEELLGAIAPRPVLVIAPQLDRDAHPGDVRAAVDEARRVYRLYGAADRLSLEEPWDYNRLPQAFQDSAIRWMAGTGN